MSSIVDYLNVNALRVHLVAIPSLPGPPGLSHAPCPNIPIKLESSTPADSMSSIGIYRIGSSLVVNLYMCCIPWLFERQCTPRTFGAQPPRLGLPGLSHALCCTPSENAQASAGSNGVALLYCQLCRSLSSQKMRVPSQGTRMPSLPCPAAGAGAGAGTSIPTPHTQSAFPASSESFPHLLSSPITPRNVMPCPRMRHRPAPARCACPYCASASHASSDFFHLLAGKLRFAAPPPRFLGVCARPGRSRGCALYHHSGGRRIMPPASLCPRRCHTITRRR
ncbi:hypothetical protein JB92DRAFT_116794 [Gautieria morchelliformis]|nr:hypothetical protein JB92DRAFT_116794 [Gautieria morchelliformis]